MYKRKRAGNTITRKINSTKDTAAKADKNHYISNSYLEGFIPIDTEYFTASLRLSLPDFYRLQTYLSFGLLLLLFKCLLASFSPSWPPSEAGICLFSSFSSAPFVSS